MSPITGAAVCLSSLSLFLMLRPRPGGITRHLPGVLGGLVPIADFVGTIGYLFGTSMLYGSNIIPAAAMTAMALILFALEVGDQGMHPGEQLHGLGTRTGDKPRLPTGRAGQDAFPLLSINKYAHRRPGDWQKAPKHGGGGVAL